MSNEVHAQDAEQLKLLREIHQDVRGIRDEMAVVERKALINGAVAGAVSGGMVAVGVLLAKAKLGL